jgi:CheY-like chemotaxis protein
LPVKVLVVEDNPIARVTLEKILAHAGFLVHSVGTLREGHEKLDGSAAIILDLDLPDGKGVELLRRIRTENKTVKVLVATGSGDPQVLDEVKELQPDALLRKPLDAGELVKLLELDADKPTPPK